MTLYLVFVLTMKYNSLISTYNVVNRCIGIRITLYRDKNKSVKDHNEKNEKLQAHIFSIFILESF